MDFTYDRMNFLIESFRRSGKSAVAAHEMLVTSWPGESPNLRRVQQIMKELNEGTRTTFERPSGSGCTISITRRNAIDAVSELIEESPNLSERQIAKMLNINDTMVHRILSEDLELVWFRTFWIPHKITDVHRQLRVQRCEDMLQAFASRITQANLVIVDEKWYFSRYLLPRNDIGSWLGPYGDRLQTPRRQQQEKKYLVYTAVTLTGNHYFKISEGNINSDNYIQFLKDMQEHLQESANIRFENMSLQQDNATPHTARATLQFLEDKNVRLIKQAPYSPDTNMCDRFIFPRMESLRRNQDDFQDKEALTNFLTVSLPTFTAQMMRKEFETMKADLQKIIEKEGHYL